MPCNLAAARNDSIKNYLIKKTFLSSFKLARHRGGRKFAQVQVHASVILCVLFRSEHAFLALLLFFFEDAQMYFKGTRNCCFIGAARSDGLEESLNESCPRVWEGGTTGRSISQQVLEWHMLALHFSKAKPSVHLTARKILIIFHIFRVKRSW